MCRVGRTRRRSWGKERTKRDTAWSDESSETRTEELVQRCADGAASEAAANAIARESFDFVVGRSRREIDDDAGTGDSVIASPPLCACRRAVCSPFPRLFLCDVPVAGLIQSVCSSRRAALPSWSCSHAHRAQAERRQRAVHLPCRRACPSLTSRCSSDLSHPSAAFLSFSLITFLASQVHSSASVTQGAPCDPRPRPPPHSPPSPPLRRRHPPQPVTRSIRPARRPVGRRL